MVNKIKEKFLSVGSGWHFASLPGRIAIWIILAAVWCGWIGAGWKLWEIIKAVIR